MKLPDIEYDRSMVQESSGAIARVDQARRQALDVLSSGFQAFGQELIKTQTEKAAADVEAGLAADEADLASKRYLPLAAVKDEMGDGFTTLPPEVQNHRQLVDDGQGGQVEVVPTYLVAGALFDKRAKDRIQQASEGISAQGWQASFQTAALNDLTQRKRKLAMAQAGAALDDFKQTQLATVDQYVRGRAWDQALGTIDRSQALSEGEKATKREDVLAARQKDEATTAKVQAAAQVEATSSGILQGARIPGYDWLDPAKALAAVEAMPNTDPAKDDVRKLVEHQVMKSEQLRDRAGKDMLNRAQSMLNQGVPLEGAQMAPVKAWMLDPANGAAGYWDALERGVRTEQRVARAERNARIADDTRASREEREAAAKAAAQAKLEQKAKNEAALLAFQQLDLKDRAKVTDPVKAFPDADDPTRRAILVEAQKSAQRVQKGQEVGYTAFQAQVGVAIAGLEKEDADKVKLSLDRWYWAEKDKAPEVDPGQVAVSQELAKQLVVLDVPWGANKPAGALDDTRGMKPAPEDQQVYEPARRALQAPKASAPAAPKAPAQADVDRVQAQWKSRFPGRPPLTADQVARVLAAQGAK